MTKQRIYNADGKSSEDRALDLFADMMIERIQSLSSKDGWKKPWFTEGSLSWPKNLSGREYNGMNALMLMMHCEKNGYKLPVFCTFDRVAGLNFTKDKQGKRQQVKGKGGEVLPQVSILKGEKSFPVFITTFTVVNKETKERVNYDDYRQMSEELRQQYNVYPKLQVYNVFNVSQTNLQEARPELYKKVEESCMQSKPMEMGDDYSFPPVDKMIKEDGWICPIKPLFGDSAYYSISKNEIVIPEKKQFKDGESFYSNLFHEMTHSTGAEGQLDRIKPTSFGSEEYAREELVAELTAALTAQRYGMTKHLKGDSAAYLKSWLDSLKESPQFIKTTLMDVKKASSMLTQHIDKMALEIEKTQSAKEENTERNNLLNIEDGDYTMVPYNGSTLYIQHHENENSLKVAVPTDKGLEVKLTIPYDHNIDLDRNYQEAFAQYKNQTEIPETKEKVYYASVAYLQSTDDTSELDKLKDRGDYNGLLTLAKDYYDGNGMDEEQTYKKPCQNRGDDLLIEYKDFAVVYNGSVGGTYEVFVKYSEQEVRDHINRYGIGRASEDVKEVAREMTHEAFTALAQHKQPVFQMPNGAILNLQYNKQEDNFDVGTVTNAGLSVKHSFPYDHNHSMDMNIQGVYEQLHEMEEYQKEEHVAKSAFHR
ncbi:zincin-like metallopeptidase domain-containing protein [uncultured Prevotella sp.]|uniref:zincin-like metallopeptidase domain-containing protein n=1 Tax=uncultured Prevotella sp. TaxID=159272 RepID=UPI0027DD3EC2|nr:zincin-like metallopeptidase domain-containing protein [uncultured Prevotella sp.]